VLGRAAAEFAIGRSIFVDAVNAYAADPNGFDRESAVESLARSYRRFVDVYEAACRLSGNRGSPSSGSGSHAAA
jgi:myo-inositol catabolism protein IolC